MSKENKNLVLGALLIGGLILMSRRRPLANTAQLRGNLWGAGSMPASQGSGSAQFAAGLIGSLAQWAGQKVSGVINSNPVRKPTDPVPAYDYQDYPEYQGNQVAQNLNLDENPTSPTYWGE